MVAIKQRVRSAHEGVDEEEEVRYRGERHHCIAQSVVLSVPQQQLTQRLHDEGTTERIREVVVEEIEMEEKRDSDGEDGDEVKMEMVIEMEMMMMQAMKMEEYSNWQENNNCGDNK